jgi:hypothetical protein
MLGGTIIDRVKLVWIHGSLLSRSRRRPPQRSRRQRRRRRRRPPPQNRGLPAQKPRIATCASRTRYREGGPCLSLALCCTTSVVLLLYVGVHRGSKPARNAKCVQGDKKLPLSKHGAKRRPLYRCVACSAMLHPRSVTLPALVRYRVSSK